MEIGLKPQKVGIGSPRKMLNKRNPQYYSAKVEGCCRAWGALLGAISMYKGWSFSTGCLGARNFLKGRALANPEYYDAKVEGCRRAWGVRLGAISMYKGWSFSTNYPSKEP